MNAIATETKLDSAALDELAGSFRGQLVGPDDPEYTEQRKVWNGSIARSPALIARCTGVADVVAAVRFARETALQVAVKRRLPRPVGVRGRPRDRPGPDEGHPGRPASAHRARPAACSGASSTARRRRSASRLPAES